VRTLEEAPSDWAFVAVAVDPVRDEIVLQSGNRATLLVYDRLANSTSREATKPKRIIEGPKSKIGNGGIYVDPTNGDIYSATVDQRFWLVVHTRTAEGDVSPIREHTRFPKAFALGVDDQTQELFLTSQAPADTVFVYAKGAKGNDAPIRILQGPRTQLADVFGMALDTKNQLMYVANRGYSLPRWGDSVSPASITVYPLRAGGDTPPLRVIQGPKTRLNWPGQIYLDIERQELFVANAFDDSILVFRASASGDVAPVRVLKGSRTGLKNPHGLFVDEKNGELVVANYGNYTATVYPRMAEGNAPPKRTIRAAPQGRVVPIFSHTPGLAYDSKRDEFLVPSCIIQPQIAALAKLETGEIPTRTIGGWGAKLARDAHEIRYDPVHDEIVTVNPYAKAILTFRGAARGGEPPIRVIHGPRTQIDTLMLPSGIIDVDGVHDEIFAAGRGAIRVFSRTANGEVPPIRVISGSDTKLEGEAGQVAVDPVNNLLAVGLGGRGPGRQGRIVIFNRTDQGNVKPRAVIEGPKTTLMNSPSLLFYPDKGLIVALMVRETGYITGNPLRFLDLDPPSEVGVWSIHDNGDVPPRLLLGGPKARMSGNEFIMNPKAKEIIVGGPTALRTYHVPEIFEGHVLE
jgi:DNA-binding beta-propeller fold protein YncE